MTESTVGGGGVRRLTSRRRRTALGDRGWALGLVAAVLLGLSWEGIGHGAPGDLDPTFGTGGIAVSFGPHDMVRAMVQQPDGKLIVAGTSISPVGSVGFILLVRYLPDGRGDPAFGAGGKVTTLAGNSSSATALVLQPDGKLLVAGSATVGATPDTPLKRDLLLARFSSDGHLDASFGSGGLLTTTVESNSGAFALLQQPDGKLVVAGRSDPAPANNQRGTAFLVRYDADGRVDGSFGTEGTVTIGARPTGVPGGVVAGALIQQPDGKLVVSASSGPPGTPRVVRVLPDGRLDATFGTGGTVTIAGGVLSGISLVLQPDGKLVVAGTSDPAPANNFTPTAFLVRYHTDGRVDTSFGTGGTATTAGVATSGTSLVLQPDGKLVVAGTHVHTPFPPLSDMLLSRFQPDGRLDGTFGAGGTASMTVTGTNAVSALLQQPDGRLVTAGTRSPSPPATIFASTAILLARYQALGCPAADPDPCLASLADFVTEVYQAALARTPDAEEEAFWVEVLASEPTLDTARGMLHTVFDGPEFRQRPVNPWQYVEALYLAMLGREPASAEIDRGVQAVLDRVNTLLPGLVDSPEFQRLVPSCQDQAAVTRLVERLYQYALRRGGSPAEWTQAIITWCAVEEGVEDFLNSVEYLAVPRTLADHITVLYRALLAREPDAGGLAQGVEYLAGQLAALEDDIMASPEFEAHVYRLFP